MYCVLRHAQASGELEALMVEKLGPHYRDLPQPPQPTPAAATPAPAAPAVAAGAEPKKATAPTAAAAAAAEPKEAAMERVRALVGRSPVMLFMKGTPEQPRCGFSGKVGAPGVS